MTVRTASMMIFLTTFLVVVSGCTGIDGNALPQEKYVAIQEDLNTGSAIVEGNYTLYPHIVPPPLPYNYDGSVNGSNWVSGSSWDNNYPAIFDNYYPAVNDSFKVLYGTTYYRDVALYDTSTGMRIRGVYSFPYRLESGFVLQSIDRNGTIYGSYNNTSIVLWCGEQWMSPAAIEIRSGNGTGFDQKPFAYMASFNTTWTITNLGVFDKANLTRYNNSVTATGFNQVYTGADPMGQ